MKLFIIDKVIYVKETNSLQFYLYIPLKTMKKTNPLILPYESLERATKLLDCLKDQKIHVEITELDENARANKTRSGHPVGRLRSKMIPDLDLKDLEMN